MAIKVLVIEDNEQNLYMMNFLLEKNGYEVCQACDGPTGLKMAKTERPLFRVVSPGPDN